MPEYQAAITSFQARYGAEWYVFLNSPMWRAARALVAEFSPSRKLPSVATPADIVAFGVVFAANDQGYFDALQMLENLATPGGGPDDPTFHPSYLPDEPAPRPAPAPEVPPAAPAPPPAPRHRKASPKPTTPKR